MSTLHCALENGADLYVNERQKILHYCTRSTEERRRRRRKKKKKEEEEEEEERRMPNHDFFYFVRCVRKIVLYSDVIHPFDWKSAVEHDGGV